MHCPDTVVIQSLGNRVGGIARPENGPAVFVRGALPGERVRVAVAAEAKNYIEAELLSIESPSPHRTEPFCRFYGICGGCSLQHLEYGRQLHWKREWVAKALRGITGIPPVEYPVASPSVTGYRNRVTFEVADGVPAMHAFRGNPVNVDSCPLMNSVCRSALESLVRTGIPPGARRISIRGGENTQEAGIEIWCDKPPDMQGFPYPVHWGDGTRWKSLNGGTVHERIGSLCFPVPPGGFFQINTGAAAILTSIVAKMALVAGAAILDLYGGVGTFGLPLALAGNRVVSVEMNREASACCFEAARLNGLQEGMLRPLATRDRSYLSNAISRRERFDVIVTDPPRAGMGIRTSRQLGRLQAERIIYVSCNPFSAVRDIEVLTTGGYALSRAVPVDMFPHTDHIETVFLLERS